MFTQKVGRRRHKDRFSQRFLIKYNRLNRVDELMKMLSDSPPDPPLTSERGEIIVSAGMWRNIELLIRNAEKFCLSPPEAGEFNFADGFLPTFCPYKK